MKRAAALAKSPERNDEEARRSSESPLSPKGKSRKRMKATKPLFILCLLSIYYSYCSHFRIDGILQDHYALEIDTVDERFEKSKESLSKTNPSIEKTDSVVLEEKRKDISKPVAPAIPSSPDLIRAQEHDYNHNKPFSYTSAIRSLQELTQSPAPGSIVCPSPYFTPIYDKIVPIPENQTDSTSSATNRKIPRIIHVSFNDRCVPNELAESITRWQNTLPDHSIFFHDDQAVQRLIGTEDLNTQLWHTSEDFPELRKNIRCVKFKGAMLIDIWRMLIVWTYGGLYTDIDNWPGPKFDSKTTIRAEDSFFSLSDVRERPSQWLFGMTPKHPIAIFTLQEISRRLLRVKNIARPRVVQITGPQTLKMAFRKFNLLLEQNATIFGDSSYYTPVQKIDLPESDYYAKGKLGFTFDDIVEEFVDKTTNITYTNITKRRKVELLSGVIHWTEEVKLGNKMGNDTHKEDAEDTNTTTYDASFESVAIYDWISCTDYLASQN